MPSLLNVRDWAKQRKKPFSEAQLSDAFSSNPELAILYLNHWRLRGQVLLVDPPIASSCRDCLRGCVFCPFGKRLGESPNASIPKHYQWRDTSSSSGIEPLSHDRS